MSKNTNQANQVLDRFLAKKAEIDTMLTRIQALSEDHFGISPEELHWGHVGTLSDYAGLLKRITDVAFKEGEFAELLKPRAQAKLTPAAVITLANAYHAAREARKTDAETIAAMELAFSGRTELASAEKNEVKALFNALDGRV
jgi:hypothetical protein